VGGQIAAPEEQVKGGQQHQRQERGEEGKRDEEGHNQGGFRVGFPQQRHQADACRAGGGAGGGGIPPWSMIGPLW